MKNQSAFGLMVASAAASLLLSAPSRAQAPTSATLEDTPHCQNNTCKGHAACMGFGNNSCAGMNDCKGFGKLNYDNQADCEKDGRGIWHP